jgi:hypothetical protein
MSKQFKTFKDVSARRPRRGPEPDWIGRIEWAITQQAGAVLSAQEVRDLRRDWNAALAELEKRS